MRNFLSFLLLVVALELGCSKEPPKQAGQPAVAVASETVVVKDVPEMLQAVGTVEALNEAVLSAKIMGAITAFRVDEGSIVKKGEILITMDSADISAKKREAEAAKDEAKAALANADINYERMSNLYKEQAVTKKELDDMNTQHSLAKARVAQAEAGVAQADAMLGYSVIRSPISGTVSAKMANTGEMAAPGRPLVRIMDGSDVRLRCTVKENEVAGIKKGDTVKVTVDALPGRELSGRVSEILPAADPATRSFSVKIDLPKTEGMKPGMFGRAWLPIGSRRAVLLPMAALVDKEGMQGVYVVTPEGRLRFQAVRLGSEADGAREALSGLSGGEKVAVGGLDKLHEGMRVLK